MFGFFLSVRQSSSRRTVLSCLLGLVASAGALQAASTGTTALHTPQGSGAGTANGDYITSSLNVLYRYFIEVPPGLGRLTVEVFDADIGGGGNNDETNGRDRDRGGYDTQVDYSLIRPDGSTAATLNNCDDNTCNDNVWTTLLNSTTAQNTAAGHWELRVDMRTNATNGDDINAFGIRAHDGTSGSGGTELNIYYDSQASFGVNPPGSGTQSRSYDLFPYITSGCSSGKNDFDFDSNRGNTGSVSFASRTGAFSQSYTSTSMSGDDAWRRDSFSGWTSDTRALDYGIWSADLTITSYTVSGTPNGNYGHLWMSNYTAAANPPAANPTTNAFRVYLPNDGGTAAVKPYVEQEITHKSGPNPVPVGQSTIYQVTVRVANPTPNSITFSASNLVTANIPGGGAVYNGNAAVGQGSIVSQPAVNGTGNVTWNPGTVSSGTVANPTYAILTYQVRVTPTSAGQRIPVTATPGSGNGTRAQYVDQTGNTTQARATYLFGPLCELAVTQGQVLTEAVVSSFQAFAEDDGGVRLEWRTASEAGTAGFYLYRWDRKTKRYLPLHQDLLVGLLHAPQGGVYRFLDDSVSPREPQAYLLEEVEAGGRRRLHGPFRAAVDPQRPAPMRSSPLLGAYDRTPHPPSREAAPEVLSTVAATRAIAQARKARDGIHIAVRETGLVRVPGTAIAELLEMPLDKIEKRIEKGKLSLTRAGQPVAWFPDLRPDGKGATGLFFYGEALDSLYSEANVYRIERDNERGLLMEVARVQGVPAVEAGAFLDTRHTETDAFPATAVSSDPEADYWFWDFLLGGDATFGRKTFALAAPGVAAGEARLEVGLHGATASGVTEEHRVTVSLNGTLLGETRWQGITARRAAFAVPSGLLLDSGNQVEITAQIGDGAPFSIVYVDGFDLSYPRRFRAAGDALTFTADANPQVTVAGFSSSAVRLLDVRDPLRPRWIEGAAVGPDGASGFRLSFVPSPQARYLAVAPAAVKAPAALRPWSAAELTSRKQRVDYLVLAPPELREAAQRLADYRQRLGLETLVVDLDQVMDEFNAGISDPRAIRDFLTYAYSRWNQPPRYVVLAGEGTLDYRNLLGYGDNVLPPLMVQTPSGLFPSDNRLADGDGDGLPEMAIGRIPVLTAAELDAYVDKIAAYEAADPAWAGNVLLLADAPSEGTDFGADSRRLAEQLPSLYTAEQVDLTTTPLADARTLLFDALGRGTSLVSYLGHGGLDRLSGGGLLTSADVPSLANADRLPVLTAMTCTVNRFAVPGVPSLGELMVKKPNGGAAAVLGPSGLALHPESWRLGAGLYRRTPELAEARLGDLILAAYREHRNLGGDPALLDIYNLLGDPALRVPLPPAAPLTGGTSGE